MNSLNLSKLKINNTICEIFFSFENEKDTINIFKKFIRSLIKNEKEFSIKKEKEKYLLFNKNKEILLILDKETKIINFCFFKNFSNISSIVFENVDKKRSFYFVIQNLDNNKVRKNKIFSSFYNKKDFSDLYEKLTNLFK